MVELNRDLKALTRSTYEGAIEVGRINSYLIIPVGSRRIVAMVTRVELTEDIEAKTDKNMVSLPSARRILEATMIGSIDENQFRQGINLFPVLDSKVFLTTKEDLDAIFGKLAKGAEFNPDEPGYCIPIGKSAVFPDYDIKMDPDAFFGKHAAIIGSTGSGKSCSIATILQSVISDTRVAHTRIVILDTNGEYRTAFQRRQQDGNYVDAFPNRRSLYIPTDSAEVGKLAIPYWFMDSDDFVRLFRAAPGVQRPVLLNALTLARQERQGPHWTLLRDTLIQECHRILALTATGSWQDKSSISVICDGVVAALATGQNQTSLSDLLVQYPSLQQAAPSNVFGEVKTAAGRHGTQDYSPLGMADRQRSESLLNTLISALSTVPVDGLERGSGSADWPSYFSKTTFRYRHLENAMSRDQTNSPRARDNCSTMLTRIYRLLEDSRFEFLFGPCAEEWPAVRHALATFLRDILGLESGAEASLSAEDDMAAGVLPFYDRQRATAQKANVVIVDLSLLASEVLENVTALIGRLIHEFLQRLSDPISGVGRGEFPIVLVLEEAQNYIRETGRSEEDSISKQVFERIAREGRKYGLGLVVASQRPSELSKTVLSQCNSFIVHRLQNPEDLRYFREIVPGIYVQLLNQLPALAPRSALVLGECVQAPVLVVMRECDPQPRSKNPKFFKSWTSDVRVPDVEAVCAKWEGTQAPTPQGVAGESAIADGQP
jgi:DNA helicase HerA-like ATPase